MKEIPQWQQDLVLKRFEQARLHPEKMLDWDEVSKTLRTDLIKPKSNINGLITNHIKRIKSWILRKSGHV